MMESRSQEETLEIGRRIGARMQARTVLALYGGLGTGKTVFSRGLARGLGIEEPVTSPSFTVVQEYECPDGRMFFHLDMYRIATEDEALMFGIDEYLFADHAVAVIEWAERIERLLQHPEREASRHGSPVWRVYLEHAGTDTRRIHLPPALSDIVA